jgi:hypothetical protein
LVAAASPSPAQDRRGADQRDRRRRHRRHVVERDVGVEDGQEGDRHQQGRQQRDQHVVEEAPRGEEDEGDRAGSDHRGGEAGGEEEIAAGREVDVLQRGAVTEDDPELGDQQIGERRRVHEVMRIERRSVEHPRRAAHVEPLLVGLVAEREPVLDPPEAQSQSEQDQPREDQRPAGHPAPAVRDRLGAGAAGATFCA